MSVGVPPEPRPLPVFGSREESRDDHLPARSPAGWYGSVLGILAVGALDYITGVELRVFPLYFLPLAYGAWWLGRIHGAFLVGLVTVTWLLANVLVDPHAATPGVWAFNALAQLTAFAIPVALITELRRRLREERSRSFRDPLTGLLNSRAFRDYATKILAFARRQRLPVTIAYLDLDNFKAVNDLHGHEAGDLALNVVADALTRHSRASDLIARMGGDEFAILLLDSAPGHAELALERIRAEVGQAMTARQWPVTASVGAVSYEVPPDSSRDLLSAADDLMYRAKRAGKDRLHLERAER